MKNAQVNKPIRDGNGVASGQWLGGGVWQGCRVGSNAGFQLIDGAHKEQ
jgi:hypothetical protein